MPWLEMIFRGHDGNSSRETVYAAVSSRAYTREELEDFAEEFVPSWMKDLTGYTIERLTIVNELPPAVAFEKRKEAERSAVGALRYLARRYREWGLPGRAEALEQTVLPALQVVLDSPPETPREGEPSRPLSSNGQDTGL